MIDDASFLTEMLSGVPVKEKDGEAIQHRNTEITQRATEFNSLRILCVLCVSAVNLTPTTLNP